MLSLIQTHILATGILVIIYFSIKRTKSRRFLINKIFSFLVLSNFLILLFDSLSIVFDGKTDSFSVFIMPLSMFLYYFMHPVIIIAWAFYVDYHIYADNKRFKNLALLLSPFLIVNTIFSALSLFDNYIFFIDQNNHYIRGNLFYIVVFTSYILMLITMIHLMMQRHLIRKSDFKALFFFPFPPLLVAVYQVLNQGVQLIWPFMSLSVMLVYIFVQSRITSTDSLTGVSNRSEYEYQVEQRSKGISPNKKIGGIMIDVNDLKLINDQYMHHAGDMALVKLAEILKTSVRKDDFVARIGGDEFVIIFDADDPHLLQTIIKRIKDKIEIYNQDQSQKFELSISIGYGLYDHSKFMSFQEFIKELDRRMYLSKSEKKRYN